MSVTSVTAKRYEGGDIDQNYVRRYAVVYEVITNDPLDGVITVLNATVTGTAITFYQLIGRTYMDQDGVVDAGALCVGIHPQKNTGEGNRLTWEVRCEFASKARDPAQAIEDPLARPQEVNWDTDTFEKEIEKAPARVDSSSTTNPADVELNAAVVASNGEKFDRALSVDDSRRVIVVQRNTVAFDDALADFYQDTVNNDTVTIKGNVYTPGILKCKSITGQTVWENGLEYVHQTITIHVRRDGWIIDVLDRGTFEKDKPAAGQIRRMLDSATGATVTRLLDGSGAVLAVGGTPVYRRFRGYAKAAFAGLNLPT